MGVVVIAALLASAQGGEAQRGAGDAANLSAGPAPSELVLESVANVRGPGDLAVDVTVEPQAPERAAECNEECGDLRVEVTFRADGERFETVTVDLGPDGGTVTVLAPEGVLGGEHDVRVTAKAVWTPGTEPPGEPYRVAVGPPYVEGEAFAATSDSPVPAALAGIGLAAVFTVLGMHYVRELK